VAACCPAAPFSIRERDGRISIPSRQGDPPSSNAEPPAAFPLPTLEHPPPALRPLAGQEPVLPLPLQLVRLVRPLDHHDGRLGALGLRRAGRLKVVGAVLLHHAPPRPDRSLRDPELLQEDRSGSGCLGTGLARLARRKRPRDRWEGAWVGGLRAHLPLLRLTLHRDGVPEDGQAPSRREYAPRCTGAARRLAPAAGGGLQGRFQRRGEGPIPLPLRNPRRSWASRRRVRGINGVIYIIRTCEACSRSHIPQRGQGAHSSPPPAAPLSRRAPGAHPARAPSSRRHQVTPRPSEPLLS